MCDDGCRKVEGSRATARLTAELLRSVISQSKLATTNQPATLIDAVRDVGEKLIAANPIGRSFFNFCFAVLIMIRFNQRQRERMSFALPPILGPINGFQSTPTSLYNLDFIGLEVRRFGKLKPRF